MTVSVPIDLLRREFRLLIPLLLSLRPQFRTRWFSKTPFPEELVAQPLKTNIRFDALHSL
jgi:hypothetical protein